MRISNHKFSPVIKKFLIISWVSRLGSPPPAHAYLNPGTGSYFTQLLIASFLGGLVTLKNYWHQIYRFFANFFKKSPGDDQKGV